MYKKIVLYAGLPRLIIENINSIKRLGSGENTKSFFALWKNNDESQIAIEYLNKNVANVYAILIDPREYIWEKKIDSSMFKDANYERCLMQYDALQQCFNFASAILKSKKYDYLWVRSRSDILFQNISSMTLSKNCDLEIPGINYSTGYCDYFAIGNYWGIKSYCNHLETIIDLMKINIYLPPEQTLALHLNRNRIEVKINRTLPKILLTQKDNNLKRRNFLYIETSRRLIPHPGQFITSNLKEEKLKITLFRVFKALFIDIFWLFIYHIKNNFKFIKKILSKFLNVLR